MLFGVGALAFITAPLAAACDNSSSSQQSAQLTADAGVTTHGKIYALGTSGFTLENSHGIATVTVAVSSSTTYVDEGVASPGFSNLAVGDRVEVMGMVASPGVLNATNIVIEPPRMYEVEGTVNSVGSSNFLVVKEDGVSSVTVDVTSSTLYYENGVSSPGFSNLATGEHVFVVGTKGAIGVLDASKVAIANPTATSLPSQKGDDDDDDQGQNQDQGHAITLTAAFHSHVVGKVDDDHDGHHWGWRH